MAISSYCHIGLAGVLVALCGISCTVMAPLGEPGRVLYHWHDDFGPGKVSVRVSLSDQIAEFERGGRDIGWCYVATGRQGYGTSPGSYQIMEKIVDKYSTHYGWIEDAHGNVVIGDASPRSRVPKGLFYVPAPMPYWMRLTSWGIGMHGGLIPDPGKPASHGCIRIPKEFAPILFDSVEVGTPVIITGGKSKRGLTRDIQYPSAGMDDAVIPSRRNNRTFIQGLDQESGVTAFRARRVPLP